MSGELKFKIATPAGEFRRLRFENVPSWNEFQEHIQKNIVPGQTEFVVQYFDEEGDKVSIGSQQEWREALEILAETNKKNKQDLLKLFIVNKPEPKAQCSGSKPSQPQPSLDGLRSIVEQFVNPGVLETFLSSAQSQQSCEGIKALLEQVLQPANMELVISQLPTLMAALNSGINKNVQTDEKQEEHQRHHHCHGRHSRGPKSFEGCQRQFPLNPRRRFWFHKLHRTGYQFLIEKNFSAAKECYEELVRLAPMDNLALYNLSCTYSLLSASLEGEQREEQQQKALETLRKAIACGYSNSAHLESDSDFDVIRNRQEFVDILASLKKDKAQEPQAEEKKQQEETKEESIATQAPPKKEEQVEEPPKLVQQNEATVDENKPKNQDEDYAWFWDQPARQPNKEAERNEFEAEMKQLEEMGFTDKERNLALLRRKRGNLGRVLARLLD